MDLSNIKVISFDVTGTLIEPSPSIGAIYGEVLRDFSIEIPDEELDLRFMAAFHQVRKNPRKEITQESEMNFWQQVITRVLQKEVGSSTFEQIFEALWHTFADGNRWKTKPRLLRILKHLRSHHYQLIVVSNWDERLYNIFKSLQLTELFGAIHISAEAGRQKPDPTWFEAIAKDSGLEAHNFLHIGDSISEDFKAPREAGWHSLLLQKRIPYGMEAFQVLGSLDELPRILNKELIPR